MRGRRPNCGPVEPGPPEETYVLAVDLGTGGPKVAVVTLTGRIVAHAFESVGIALTR